MNKIIALKNQIARKQDVLKRYLPLIPKPQQHKFNEDLMMIFRSYDKSEDEDNLKQIDKLASIKLKSVERIYPSLREETKEEARSVQKMLDFAESDLVKAYKEEDETGFSIENMKKRIREMPGFNAKLVKQYQEDYFEYQTDVAQAWDTVIKEKQEREKKNMKPDPRSKEDIEEIEHLKNQMKEVMYIRKEPDIEEFINSIDFDQILRQIRKEEELESKRKAEILEKAEEKNFRQEGYTDDLFKPFSPNKSDEKIQNELKLKIDEIQKDETLNEEEKTKKINLEVRKAEQQWINKHAHAEIKLSSHGLTEFTFYEDKDEGVKTYVMRDGKLVEGKAKERKAVTYSNWHGGNVDPEDMRKHRALLDRQHYGGPLWEGIKVKSIMDDPASLVVDTSQCLKEDPMEKLAKGKKEFVEVSR